MLSFWTAEEQGRIAATLTRVNVKVNVVAGDGGDGRDGGLRRGGVLVMSLE